ncbi:DUF4097 family beta strand repeat protein [Tissierella sp. MSJ-40]|uniref:DUF4097 family beta strand repeat protein n=1 Tax=Tissierella simiarum TaxID=2841534 RepID=A0ABS6E8U3_9FIRM|nr:DUF4097 family beta strand repeat-containing protein [Tissierella simiarum]MBU5439334.1 DUF4097 family beta strand repeat protein [Tissierella simiarum]
MREEKMMILSMLEEGKITSEEAVKLMEALEEVVTFSDDTPIEEKKDRLINMDKTIKKVEEIEKVIKEQGKKVETLGSDIGNKISNMFSGLKDMGNSVNFTSNYETINTTLEKDISHMENPIIDFRGVNGNIIVNSWDQENLLIKVTCQYKYGKLNENDTFYNFYEDGNKIVFSPAFSSNISIRLEVYLPEKKYEEISLTTSNGRIDIDDFNLNTLKCDTSNSSIGISDIAADNVLLVTRNGKISIKDVSSPNIKANSTNSNISLRDINSTNLEVSTVNGRIVIEDVVSLSIIGSTSNSSIDVNDISCEILNLTTSNGKITCDDIDEEKIKEIKLITSNASINSNIGEVEKNSYFDLETSLGSINLEIPNLVYKINKQAKLGIRKIVAHSIAYKEEENHLMFIASTSNGSIKIY